MKNLKKINIVLLAFLFLGTSSCTKFEKNITVEDSYSL